MRWVLWAAVLMAQGGSSTWASRARNTGSPTYHGVAAVFSHGVWFVSNVFLLDSVVDVARSADWTAAAWIGLFYTTFCTVGSVTAHVVTARYLETGTRKVGA